MAFSMQDYEGFGYRKKECGQHNGNRPTKKSLQYLLHWNKTAVTFSVCRIRKTVIKNSKKSCFEKTLASCHLSFFRLKHYW